MENKKFVKIGPLPGRNYAEMIGEVLKERNIPFTLTQDAVATAYGISGTNLAGNEAFLLVPEEFEADVRDIIEQMIDHI